MKRALRLLITFCPLHLLGTTESDHLFCIPSLSKDESSNRFKAKFIPCLRTVLIGAVLFQSISIFGQNKISGKITDAVTGEPLSFVNVFFVGTTIGASTSTNGLYTISGFQPGKYDLIISLVGYKRKEQSLEFTSQSQLTLDFQLEVDPVQLSEVLVKEDTSGWKRNYEEFKRHFLGRSDHANKVVIQNPHDIHLYFDKQTSTLVAHAKKPIQVVNQSTGYRIRYYLEYFEYRFGPGLLNLYGFPVFESLPAKNARVERRWERERLKAYEGSLMHFIRAWKSGRLIEEGYKVSRVFKVNNPRRPNEALLARKISELQKKEGDDKSIKDDSLRYYYKLKSLPLHVDSIANESLHGPELFDAKKDVMNFTGGLVIEYKEKEELSYAHYSGRDFTVKQKSLLRISSPLRLYENGYFEDVHDLILEKYWAWTENTSTLLPLDYYPRPLK